MRVISGEYKGRKLYSPQTDDVRPTTDRVKEAIFSILAPDIDDTVVLDLFAGSGSLGIEALSRGAAFVYFCDNSERSISLVRQNVEMLDISEKASIINCDYRKVKTRISKKVDIVLIDSPYHLCDYPDILISLRDGEFLSDSALIVIERVSKSGGYDVPDMFSLIKTKKYGNTEVDVLLLME